MLAAIAAKRFDEYLRVAALAPWHPELKCAVFARAPATLAECPHLLFHGVAGAGKYTQALVFLERYSPSRLSVVKKMVVPISGSGDDGWGCGGSRGGSSGGGSAEEMQVRRSDVHFEVDLSLLGCNTKTLWPILHAHMLETVASGVVGGGSGVAVVLCKKFHELPRECMAGFSHYLRDNHMDVGGSSAALPTRLVFMLLSEEVSFLPAELLDMCVRVPIALPTSVAGAMTTAYGNAVLHAKCADTWAAYAGQLRASSPTSILQPDQWQTVRESLYAPIVYNGNVGECVYQTLVRMAAAKAGKEDEDENWKRWIAAALELHIGLNRNTRPIFHLERWLLQMGMVGGGSA